MELTLKGKSALVSAASKGIGFGVAEALAQAGCNVLITGSHRERLEAAAVRLRERFAVRIEARVLDMRDPGAIATRLQEVTSGFARIDIVVINGPGPKPTEAAALDAGTLQDALDTMLKSPVELCRALLPSMIEARFGRIIFLASSTAKEPDEGMVLSNVARAAVISYAKTLSREVGKWGITVNSVLTGSVLTERTDELLKFEAETAGLPRDRFLEEAAKSIPAGYICTPAEFARPVLFLCSPEAAYVNGVSLPVDGGYMRAL